MSRKSTRRDLITGRIVPPLGREHTPELHVSSLVIHARPERIDAVKGALALMSGVEVHGGSLTGKIVITMETANEHEVVAQMGAIGELPGVLSTALVYHHFEPSSGSA